MSLRSAVFLQAIEHIVDAVALSSVVHMMGYKWYLKLQIYLNQYKYDEISLWIFSNGLSATIRTVASQCFFSVSGTSSRMMWIFEIFVYASIAKFTCPLQEGRGTEREGRKKETRTRARAHTQKNIYWQWGKSYCSLPWLVTPGLLTDLSTSFLILH